MNMMWPIHETDYIYLFRVIANRDYRFLRLA